MSTTERTVFITGVSRGLGLSLAKEYLKQPNTKVIGTVREESLEKTKSILSDPSLQLVVMDITSEESVRKAVQSLPNLAIDILILNAGMGGPEKVTQITTERLSEYFSINTLSTHRVINAFLPACRRGKDKKIIIVSSQSGSMTKQIGNRFGFGGPYGVSKVASNMLAVQFHNELNVDYKEGFVVVPLHPGWVDTDMGKRVPVGDGSAKGMDSDQVAAKVANVIAGLTIENSATFLGRDGEIIPW